MIRFYMNGTEGAQDGTEISNGDLSNPLVVDGFYPAAGVTVSKTVTVMVRADAGETWKSVVIALENDTTDVRSKYGISSKYTLVAQISNSYSSYMRFPFYPEIKDVNQNLTLSVDASGDESNSPDTTEKLMVVGGIKV